MAETDVFDFDVVNEGTPQEYDSVTVNGREFARIRHDAREHVYLVSAVLGSRRDREIARKGSHHGAFEAAVAYGSRENIG